MDVELNVHSLFSVFSVLSVVKKYGEKDLKA